MKKIKRSAGSGDGHQTGFRVEARLIDIDGIPRSPSKLADGKTILGYDWTELYFERSMNPAGVPTSSPVLDPGSSNDLLPLRSAIALAWTAVAQNQYLPMECRLVQHKLTYHWEIKRMGVAEEIKIRGDSMMWPKITDDVPPEEDKKKEAVTPAVAASALGTDSD
jgi:hypothetical protein